MFTANICTPLDRVIHVYDSTVTLPLEDFTQRNFVPDFIQMNFNFIQKMKNSLFEAPFMEVGVT